MAANLSLGLPTTSSKFELWLLMYTVDKIKKSGREAQPVLELRSEKLLEDLSERESMEMLNNVPVISSEEHGDKPSLAASLSSENSAPRRLGAGSTGFFEVSVCVHSFEEPQTYYWFKTL